MASFFEFDFFIKSCRHLIGIVAWTWAIFVFCLSYIGRGNYHYNNHNNFHEYVPPTLYQSVFVPVLKVLLVAPSTSLAGPLPQQQQQQIQAGNHNPRPATNLPWQAVGGPGGGYVYCADCSPLTQDQVVLPANFQVNQKAASEASGVLPPQQQINSLGAAEPGKQPGAKTFSDGGVPVQQMAMHDDGRYR